MTNSKRQKSSPPSWLQGAWKGPPVALFWDQSLIWGLICIETLRRLRVPFRLLTAADIASGNLPGSSSLLLVPGGWAVHKLKALGEAGEAGIRSFVEGGGSYLGFCGGAGLALSSPPALHLVSVRRMSLEARLPSASGEILIQGLSGHPVWESIPLQIPASIWWPSQFAPFEAAGITCLATYGSPGTDFRVSDLPAADLESQGMSWEDWESAYGINLDPRRMAGQPAIIEATLGKGRLVLSYPHLETPGDEWGNRLFLSLLNYLDASSRRETPADRNLPPVPSPCAARPGPRALEHFVRIGRTVEELIRFGERQLLWSWRRPWLLHWQRGIRGLEYATMAVAMRSIVAEAAQGPEDVCGDTDPWLERAMELDGETTTFCRLACRLLLEEKLAFHTGARSKLGNVNEAVDGLRERLFGSRMSHGGLCRTIMDRMDGILFDLLRNRG